MDVNKMNASLQLVERQCGRYLNTYATCINNFPETWHLDCNKQKLKLASCAETEPTIKKIKTVCADQFEKYESCVVANPVHSDHCQPQFDLFNKCAQTVSSHSKDDQHTGPDLSIL
ncbi:coiled-coil-helix-coiled-coil-helix domain-containing protein 5-like isoform X2 [Haliotis rubra]|uniref:coiled-coil-helix-coiled-coil-helix domain-containing protein 5-like isoform X2 n=1 Tax=Haliotis rubra TaxID=36100 RepID=UPI001EE57B9E|nr:coiled-coil-helix-coiled-coil-helix domain-containing protein 5-like isoform X2 [Haliotis rubra]